MLLAATHPLVGRAKAQALRCERRLQRVERELQRNPSLTPREIAETTTIPERTVRRLVAMLKRRAA